MSDSLKLKDGYELSGGLSAYFVLKNSSKLCKSLSDLFAHCEEMTSLQNGDSSLIHRTLYGQNIIYDPGRYKISIYGTLQGGELGVNRPGAFCEILSFSFYNPNNPMLDIKFSHIQASIITHEFVELVSGLIDSLLRDKMAETTDSRREQLQQMLKRLTGMIVEDDLIDSVVVALSRIRGKAVFSSKLRKALGEMNHILQVG